MVEPIGREQGLEEAGPGTHPVSRREFLYSVGLVGLSAAFGRRMLDVVFAADELTSDTIDPRHQWVMVFDLRRCDGCRDCIKGCQEEHDLPKSAEWIRVYELEDTQGKPFAMPVLCMECQNAPCTRVCPVQATFHRPDGVVVIDQDVCIGCRMCMAACPYGVRIFNWEEQTGTDPWEGGNPDHRNDVITQRQGTVGKCSMCTHHLVAGEFPACVRSCSMYAIYVGNLVTDSATNGRETVVLSDFLRANDAFRFREELGTKPRVYYIAGHGQDLGY